MPAARYARQVGLPALGEAGQRQLSEASCLVVGAGGLGSPLLLYLAGAGVGRIGVVDDDLVEESNLHRQVLHDTPSVGEPKVQSAARRLRALNPDVEIVPLQQRLDAASAASLATGYDVLADGSDNFPTRYAVNHAAVRTGTPLVWGAAQELGGQVGVVAADGGPCYRCIFPSPPPAGAVPSCAEGGVLGTVPGSLGAVMATEVLKLLAGMGTPATGSVLVHDALAQAWDRVPVRADPACPVCGDGPADQALAGAAYSGSIAPEDVDPDGVVLLDVREEGEWAEGRLPGALWWPLDRLRAAQPPPLPRGRAVVTYCASGIRSAEAVKLLDRLGHPGARSMAGGIRAWVRCGRPVLAPDSAR